MTVELHTSDCGPWGRVSVGESGDRWTVCAWQRGTVILSVDRDMVSGQIQGSIEDVLSRVPALVALVGNGAALDLADVANAIDEIGRALSKAAVVRHIERLIELYWDAENAEADAAMYDGHPWDEDDESAAAHLAAQAASDLDMRIADEEAPHAPA